MRTRRTLRRLPPLTRSIAKQLNALELAIQRIDRQLELVQRAELDAKALWTQRADELRQKEFNEMMDSEENP